MATSHQGGCPGLDETGQGSADLCWSIGELLVVPSLPSKY